MQLDIIESLKNELADQNGVIQKLENDINTLKVELDRVKERVVKLENQKSAHRLAENDDETVDLSSDFYIEPPFELSFKTISSILDEKKNKIR